jgi:peptidoglycan L-alanyl-D-glutamate endopeptidase CwlK
MSRLRTHLERNTRQRLIRLVAAAPLVMDRELFVVHTWRSRKEQDQLYAQGRTEPGPIVTNAKGGESWHNLALLGAPEPIPYSHAFDVAFEEDGTQRPTWDNQTEEDKADWQLLGDMGERIGLAWGGDWGDLGHFHWTGGMTLDQWWETYRESTARL